tara:strand:+ start:94918 stop:95118 length:201 start_codon:yes stop_codon:yes gene_type:complete
VTTLNPVTQALFTRTCLTRSNCWDMWNIQSKVVAPLITFGSLSTYTYSKFQVTHGRFTIAIQMMVG